MGALPVIRGVSAVLFPLTMTCSFRTVVGRFQNGAEQRSIGNPGGLMQFEWPNAALTQAQKNTVKGYFAAAKGQFDSTGSLSGPFGPGLAGLVTYLNLQLDSDEFAATENETMQYGAPLKLSQTITQSLSPGTPGLAFPTLVNGSMGCLPYTQRQISQTVSTRVAAGPSYSTPEFGGGFTGYPTGTLGGWILDERKLSDGDAATRLAHFIANWGRAFSYPFTDENGVTYSHANGNGSPHYAADSLVFKYNGVNDTDVRSTLELTYN
jgi:hypothetical protein